jgi:hypothetical protein
MRFALCFLAAVLLSCWHTAQTQPDYDYGDPVYVNLDFDGQDHYPWTGQYNTDRPPGSENFQYSTNTPSGSGHAAAFTLHSGGDYWLSPNNGRESARSEIELKGTAPEGQTVYYAWDFYISTSYVESSDWQVIGQFHDRPDPAQGQTWQSYPAHSPPVSFRYRQGDLILSVWDFDRGLKMDLLAAPVSKDSWHTLQFKVFWSVETDGRIEMWLDGVKLSEGDQDVYVGRNCFNPAGNYLKIGLYRSKDILTYGQILYDNVVSGATAASIGLIE